MVTLRRYADEEAWIAAIAADFIAAIASAGAEGRSAVVCLAGGSTPEPAYRAMALSSIPEPRYGPVTLVVGDERAAPRGPAELNETMIRGAFEPALSEGAAVLRGWELGAGAAASIERMAAALTGSRPRSGAPIRRPLFDACYLGLGADGHTAGIFAADGAPDAGGLGIATTSLAPAEPRQRVSLTLETLASARLTRYLIRAAGKEEALRRLAAGDPSCPAVLAAGDDAVAFILEP